MFNWPCLVFVNNLVASFQTELAINTHTMVADTHTVVADAHTMITDIHRNVLMGQESTSGQDQSVSTNAICQRRDAYHRLGSNQVSDTEYNVVRSLTFLQRASW